MNDDDKLQIPANSTGYFNTTEIVRPNSMKYAGKFTLPINFKRNVLLKAALGVTFLVMVAVAGSQTENLKSGSASNQTSTINLKVAQPYSSTSTDSSKSSTTTIAASEPYLNIPQQTDYIGQIYSSYP